MNLEGYENVGHQSGALNVGCDVCFEAILDTLHTSSKQDTPKCARQQNHFGKVQSSCLQFTIPDLYMCWKPRLVATCKNWTCLMFSHYGHIFGFYQSYITSCLSVSMMFGDYCWRLKLWLPKEPGWWFQTFFIFHSIWDNPSHWLIFFRGVETTNQEHVCWLKLPNVCWRTPQMCPRWSGNGPSRWCSTQRGDGAANGAPSGFRCGPCFGHGPVGPKWDVLDDFPGAIDTLW